MNDYYTITHAPTEKCDASPNIRRRLAYHWPAPDPSPTSSRTVCYELLVAASSPFVSSAIEIVAAPFDSPCSIQQAPHHEREQRCHEQFRSRRALTKEHRSVASHATPTTPHMDGIADSRTGSLAATHSHRRVPPELPESFPAIFTTQPTTARRSQDWPGSHDSMKTSASKQASKHKTTCLKDPPRNIGKAKLDPRQKRK